ncbi:hypothetical protein BG004_003300, partial [Podila humilis]
LPKTTSMQRALSASTVTTSKSGSTSSTLLLGMNAPPPPMSRQSRSVSCTSSSFMTSHNTANPPRSTDSLHPSHTPQQQYPQSSSLSSSVSCPNSRNGSVSSAQSREITAADRSPCGDVVVVDSDLNLSGADVSDDHGHGHHHQQHGRQGLRFNSHRHRSSTSAVNYKDSLTAVSYSTLTAVNFKDSLTAVPDAPSLVALPPLPLFQPLLDSTPTKQRQLQQLQQQQRQQQQHQHQHQGIEVVEFNLEDALETPSFPSPKHHHHEYLERSNSVPGSNQITSQQQQQQQQQQQHQSKPMSIPIPQSSMLNIPTSPIGSSCNSDSSFLGGSRRSSKDSSECVPGVPLQELLDQIIVPDYAGTLEQHARTKVFFMIYRKFLRPRELLEMFIERFEELKEFSGDDDEEARNTRLRICACLYYWLKNHPNDLIHRQTRQRVASFLRERVALYPCLTEIYVKLLPLSYIHYFNSWRWPQAQREGGGGGGGADHPFDSRSSSVSGPTFSGSISDEDSDSGFSESALTQPSEIDMDEDREWGLHDEDEAIPEAKAGLSLDRLTFPSFPQQQQQQPKLTVVAASGGQLRQNQTGSHSHLPNDHRRSSTGSLAHHQSPCEMETFVASRRGSASSVNSTNNNHNNNNNNNNNNNSNALTLSHSGHGSVVTTSSSGGGGATCFAEGDATPQELQPLTPIPFIAKRSSSQAYRQKSMHVSMPVGGPVTALQPYPHPQPLSHVLPQTHGHPAAYSSLSISNAYSNSNPLSTTSANPVLVFKDSGSGSGGASSISAATMSIEDSVHPLQGKTNPIAPTTTPAPIDYLSMNTSFLEIKDGAIAAQLTCVEFGLFRKLRPRDMLRQVWKTSRGSVAFQACIAHFNFISSWVGTMILSPPKVKNRAKMMEKFIRIAKILRDMGNFNTTMAIIGAMNTSSIHRLVQTRDLLQGKEVWTTFKELQHLMSSERSFHEYRNALKTTTLPCIPYLGVHLGDLLSISEGNRDFRQDGHIHWKKFCLLSEVISSVIHFQSEPYKIQPDPFISRVITDTHVLDDEELYTKSVGTEPGKLHHSRSLSKFNFF